MNETEESEIAAAIRLLARALQDLGTGNATTNGVGAIEMHAMTNKENTEFLAQCINSAGNTIAEALDNVAEAIRETTK